MYGIASTYFLLLLTKPNIQNKYTATSEIDQCVGRFQRSDASSFHSFPARKAMWESFQVG
jgi:hypothetical protein